VSRLLNNAAPPNANTSRSLVIPCVLFACAIAMGVAQNSPPPSQTPPPPVASARATPSPSTASDAKKTSDSTPPTTQAVVVTDPKQAQIIADSQKLLKLSQELKAEVAKSNKDTLSLTVIKKAEEVEKLAKTLKDEMNKSR
jgi:ABC-type Fe3+-hydroxamate transport system substrate-binding protein